MVDKFRFDSQKKSMTPDPAMQRPASEDKVVRKGVDDALTEAIEAGATDIYFEPMQDKLVIRMRKEGELSVLREIPESIRGNVTNRLKVLATMDFTKTHIPQGGFFKMASNEKSVELYAHLLPTLYGESIGINIQYKQSATMRLNQLGMAKKLLENYRKVLNHDTGLFLVTGPPGSGRRTTVYASILEVLNPGLFAMGYDPVVKYEIPDMVQGKLEEKSEFTFAEAVAAMFKLGPDIAYVGDIVNEAEAHATIHGSLAKRKVFGRMTANDSISAVQNFLDMGMQPFLVTAALVGVINQRLLPKLCPSCREAYPVDDILQKEIGYKLPQGTSFYRSKGCPACGNTGYKGVVGLYEIFIPNEEVRKMIVAKESPRVLRKAVQEGMSTLKQDGVRKAMAGYCTIEEVLNVL